MESILPAHFHSMGRSEKIDYLEGMATKQEEKTISLQIQHEDRQALNDVVVQDSIELSRFEEKLKEIKDQFKEDMAPLKERILAHLKTLRSGFEEVETTIYWLPDYERNRMIGVDGDGNEHLTRPMSADERQLSMPGIRSIKSAGGN